MRSRENIVKARFVEWATPYWPYPGPPRTDKTLSQRHSKHVLEISGGNHGRAVRRGLDANDPNYGGDFLVVKHDYDEQLLTEGVPHFSTTSDPMASGMPHYWGHQYPRLHTWSGSSAFPASNASSNSELIALGTTGLARILPTKPKADMGTFLGEASEGLPAAMLIASTGKRRALRALNAGDEYLKYEFGWAPLVRDVRSFASAIINAEKHLDNLRKGSGKLIKRRYEWPAELDISEGSLGRNYPTPLLAGALYGSNPRPELRTLTTKRLRRWLTASFIYYAPLASKEFKDNYVAKAQYLLGARLTPSTLWNVAPWSWALDWVGNTGDVMDNVSAALIDGLVIHHAYIMEQSSVEVQYWMETKNTWKSHPDAGVIRQSFKTTTKKRLGATPYGFGLSWDGFTQKQLAILAALKISKRNS